MYLRLQDFLEVIALCRVPMRHQAREPYHRQQPVVTSYLSQLTYLYNIGQVRKPVNAGDECTGRKKIAFITVYNI